MYIITRHAHRTEYLIPERSISSLVLALYSPKTLADIKLYIIYGVDSALVCFVIDPVEREIHDGGFAQLACIRGGDGSSVFQVDAAPPLSWEGRGV